MPQGCQGRRLPVTAFPGMYYIPLKEIQLFPLGTLSHFSPKLNLHLDALLFFVCSLHR